MKIKTIYIAPENAVEFDAIINIALEEGWHLVRRDVLPPYEGRTHLTHRMLYAELVQMDEPTEPEAIGPVEALRTIRSICTDAAECGPDCQAHEWCEKYLPMEIAPIDWKLPGDEEEEKKA